MYFHNFPTTSYDPTGSGFTNQIQDILIRVKVRDWIKNNGALFSKYIITEGDRPEIVAFKLYGDVQYAWVVLLFNKIINNYYGWPLGRRNFDAYVNEKYTNPYGINHYEIVQESGGDWIKVVVELADHPTATAVNNLEYEQNKQDKLSKIRILKPSYLHQFVGEFKLLVQQKSS